jgi:hypothetical protein
MENQHRRITGYRDLRAEDIALMNQVKALGVTIEAVIEDAVKPHVKKQRQDAVLATTPHDEPKRLEQAEPERWIAIARTKFQEALMALTRAVAQPTSF